MLLGPRPLQVGTGCLTPMHNGRPLYTLDDKCTRKLAYDCMTMAKTTSLVQAQAQCH
jgi:hypothetical protein